MDQIEETLKSMKYLFTEYGWTKGTFARDASGEKCNAWSTDAECYCLLGALQTVIPVTAKYDPKEMHPNEIKRRTLCQMVLWINELEGDHHSPSPDTMRVAGFNDRQESREDIMNFLDGVISMHKRVGFDPAHAGEDY